MRSTVSRCLNCINRLYCNITTYQAYLGILLLRLSLDIVYVFIAVSGYSCIHLDFHAYKYVLSWLVTLIMTPFIVYLYKNSSASSTIILLINLIYFIPGCTLYSLSGLPDSYFLFYFFYWIVLMVWQYRIPYIHFKLPPEGVSKRLFYIIMIIVAVGAIAISGIYNNFQMNFRLDNIYELRAIRRNMEIPTIIRYFQPLATVFIPLAIVYFLSKRKYILSLGMCVIQFLLFSFGGEKYALFVIPVAIIGYYLYRENRISWFSWGLVVLNVIAMLEFIFKFRWITTYVQYRSQFVPTLISFQYYTYFTNNTPDYLSQSILRRFGFISDYDIAIPKIIGREYWNSVAVYANNGLVGDAFSNFAWLGLLMFPLLIVLTLRLMDACAYRIDRRILITVFIGYTVSIINVPIFTVILTNGFIFMCLVLYLLPREGQRYKKYRSNQVYNNFLV